MEKKKVLVVEDEFSINDVLCFALRKEGYDVRSVFTGEEALVMAESFKPDLVLLDLMLPDIDGFEVCKEISKETYVIMLTARGELIDKLLGLELGADDYMVKPFEIKEVLARIKAVFRRNHKVIKEEEKIEDIYGIVIDKNDRRVYKDGVEIPLRRKEFDLLNFLAQNKNIVFSREELLDKVWGYDFDGELRTVDVHIRRVRSKLREDKGNSIIETVFGVGYVMR